MFTCYIGLGSNLGDRKLNIQTAIEKINRIKKTKVTKASSIIETSPVGGPAQDKYLNAAIEIQTDFPPRQLLVNLQNIESELGRVRAIKNGPRTIDLDILFYRDLQINEEDLIVPHPRIKEREFVLNPLREIAPDIVSGLCNANNQKN